MLDVPKKMSRDLGMGDKKFTESEVIYLIKRISGVEEDAELVKWLNHRYGCDLTKQKISNYRGAEGTQLTITKVMLYALAEHLESLGDESLDVQ